VAARRNQGMGGTAAAAASAGGKVRVSLHDSWARLRPSSYRRKLKWRMVARAAAWSCLLTRCRAHGALHGRLPLCPASAR
jgi:hypothetical protein